MFLRKPAAVDNCFTSPSTPTFRGMSTESMDPADMPRGVGIELKCQQILIILFFILSTAGCGFHLRGLVHVPVWLNNIAVICNQVDNEFTAQLKEQLQAYRVKICSDPAAATSWLVLENDSFQKNIVSVSSSTTPRQYQLIYSVFYKLEKPGNIDILPLKQIVVTRQLTVNSDRILGSNDEEAIFKSEIRRDAAAQIINRLSQIKDLE